jgi:hypothetical protein
MVPTWLRVVADRKAEHKRDCETAITSILTGPSSDGTKLRRDHGKLPYRNGHDTVLHMKTTLNIVDTVLAELRREAASQGRTMSEMVETAVRLLLRSHRKRRAPLPPLPTFDGGAELVDIADRNALYDAMEGR